MIEPSRKLPMRINKYLAHLGKFTRREADLLIAQGKVFLNGQMAKLGDKINRDDHLKIEEKNSLNRYYFIYNKTETEAMGDPETELTKFTQKTGTFVVDPLDTQTLGLVIITNDGRLNEKLINRHHEREYLINTTEPYKKSVLDKLSHGVFINQKRTLPAKIKEISENVFKVILRDGSSQEINHILNMFACDTKEVVRLRVANLMLKDTEKIRPIKGDELKLFLRILGLN